MPFVIRFGQRNGGGGCECHLSLVSIRIEVVVVGMNVICHSFQAGEWWWWA